MSKLVDRVESILQYDPRYRDSDKLLLLRIWQEEGLYLSGEQRQVFLNNCTVAESITRARRDLKVKYPATEVVNEARYKKYGQFKRGEIF